MRRAHVPNATLTIPELLLALLRPMSTRRADDELCRRLGVANAVSFASARGALAASVAALARGGAVALPAYTCVAVANAIRTGGGTPLYADVDGRGLVPAAGWPEAAAVVAQDTYGFVSELPRHPRVLRDASHRADLCMDTTATVTITSFEHSKWLSAGQGGLAVTDDPELAARLREARDAHPPRGGSLRHLFVTFTCLVMGRAEFAGRRRLGYWARRIARRFDEDRLKGQSEAERQGHGVDPGLLGPPNRVTLALMKSQLARIDAVRRHRTEIVALYDRAAGIEREPEPLVRYPLTAEAPSSFEEDLRRSGWDVSGRWFNGPLHPVTSGESLERLGYRAGSAREGERLAATVVNLPTHPLVRPSEAQALIRAALDAGARPV